MKDVAGPSKAGWRREPVFLEHLLSLSSLHAFSEGRPCRAPGTVSQGQDSSTMSQHLPRAGAGHGQRSEEQDRRPLGSVPLLMGVTPGSPGHQSPPSPAVLSWSSAHHVCAISHSLPPPKTSCPHILGARTLSRIKWWSITCCAGVAGKLDTFTHLTALMMSCHQHRVLHSHSL